MTDCTWRTVTKPIRRVQAFDAPVFCWSAISDLIIDRSQSGSDRARGVNALMGLQLDTRLPCDVYNTRKQRNRLDKNASHYLRFNRYVRIYLTAFGVYKTRRRLQSSVTVPRRWQLSTPGTGGLAALRPPGVAARPAVLIGRPYEPMALWVLNRLTV